MLHAQSTGSHGTQEVRNSLRENSRTFFPSPKQTGRELPCTRPVIVSFRHYPQSSITLHASNWGAASTSAATSDHFEAHSKHSLDLYQ